MPGRKAVPLLLADYLPPAPGTLTLISGTLGATTSWLVLQVLSSIPTGDTHITLFSWLHSPSFWRECARKLPLDLHKIKLHNYLSEPLPASLLDLSEQITASSSPNRLREEGTLVLDGLDFVLASTSHSSQELLSLISSLRGRFGRVIVTVQADAPFLHMQGTPLEVSQASLVISLAHQARTIFSLRDLETGPAKDVSGILRVGPGGQEAVGNGKECLYLVSADANVRVFDKGT